MKGIARTVAHKEFIETIRDNRFRIITIIILLLLSLSLLGGISRYQNLRGERIQATNHMREVWLNQGKKDPHLAAHFGTFVFRPASILSFIDPGVESYTGTSIFLEAHKMNPAQHSQTLNSTSLERFGNTTIAFVIQVLMPLLIVVLSFSAYSGERESGTMKQLTATGLKPIDLLKGKLLGIAGAFALCAIPAIIINSIALLFLSGQLLVSRAIGLIVIYSTWMVFYFLISFIISMKVRSSSLCLIFLLAFWVWNVAIAPRLLSETAILLSPTPSLSKFNEAIETDIKGKGRNLQQIQIELMKEYGVSTPDKLPVNARGVMHQRNEEISSQVWDKHFGALWNQYDRQERLIQYLSIIAPLNAVKSISMNLAGTDFKHHRSFALNAESYRRNMVQKLNQDLTYNSKNGEVYKADKSVWQSVPQFYDPPPPFSKMLYSQLPSLAILIIWVTLPIVILIRLAIINREIYDAPNIVTRRSFQSSYLKNNYRFNSIIIRIRDLILSKLEWRLPSYLKLELKNILRESNIITALALLTIACIIAIYNGKSWKYEHNISAKYITDKQQNEFDEAIASVKAFELKYPKANKYLDNSSAEIKKTKGLTPAGWSVGGWTVTIPLSAAASLFIGHGDLNPESVKVSLWNRRFDLFGQTENTNPLLMLYGRFDPAFLVIYLYPLFILGLTFNLISRDRENGTFLLLASQPIQTQRVFIVRVMLLLVLLVLPLLIITVILALDNGNTFKTITSLILWFIVAVSYVAFWFAFALAINSQKWSSRVNAVILIAGWIIVVMIIPQLTNIIINARSTLVTPAKYIMSLRDARHISESKSQTLRDIYLHEHPQLRSEPKLSLYSYWLEGWHTEKLLTPILNEQDTALNQLINLSDRLSFLSPSLLASDTLNELSGTSARRYFNYRKAVSNYHRQWHDFFAPKMFTGRRMTVTDYQHFPKFNIPEDNKPFSKAAISTSLLLLITIILFVFAWKRFKF